MPATFTPITTKPRVAQLVSTCRGTLTSAHAFSADGFRWFTSPAQPFPAHVETTDNQTLFFWSRERPKVLWSADGRMTHLSTAVSPVPDPDDPATVRFSSCQKGQLCTSCKGMSWDYTLVAELDWAVGGGM